jgi:hypothetical protein
MDGFDNWTRAELIARIREQDATIVRLIEAHMAQQQAATMFNYDNWTRAELIARIRQQYVIETIIARQAATIAALEVRVVSLETRIAALEYVKKHHPEQWKIIRERMRWRRLASTSHSLPCGMQSRG